MTERVHQVQPVHSAPGARALDLVERVLEVPVEKRAELLDAECPDPAVRREVEVLLAADAAAEGFLEGPALERDEDGSGLEIGPYRLLHKLGEGGMGEVWEAEQVSPVRRRVALKRIRGGMSRADVVARFESERQALAWMSHPNIATVFDAGSDTEGQPYFVMELVEGLPITDYCRHRGLNLHQRLQLFAALCDGVQHAHQKGVLHRDLKPSNLLVVEQDGPQGRKVPVPKIIDFGIAKALHPAAVTSSSVEALETEVGQWMGTPEYMSPEQAEWTRLGVDTRSDVYALGAVLYELLCGHLPFRRDERGLEALRRRIREEDPRPPSALVGEVGEARIEARRLRGDLDCIVLKALEKERGHRYGSAAELAADVRRYLNQQPVSARPPSLRYRLGKWVRRHRRATVLGAVVLVALLVAAAGVVVGVVRAQREARMARQVATVLEETLAGLDPGDPRTSAGSPATLLALGAERIEAQLGDQPRVRARLLGTVGRIYRNLARYDEARPLLQESLALHLQEYGREHERVGAAHHDLGWLAYANGDYVQAREHFAEALDIHQAVLGIEHPKVAWTLKDLALVLWKDGEPRAAKPLLERARELLRPFGDEHSLVADVLYHQGLVLKALDEDVAAVAVLEQALAIHRRLHGDRHPLIAWDLLDLGHARRRLEGPDAGRPLMQEALDIQREVFGDDHPNVAFPLLLLADLESSAHRLEAAEGYYQQVLDLRRQALGQQHPDLVRPLLGLARLAREAGQLDRAEALLLEARELRELALGGEHPLLAEVLDGQARLAHQRGDFETSVSLFEQALPWIDQTYGVEHVRANRWRINLAWALASARRLPESRALLEDVLDHEASLSATSAGRTLLQSGRYNLACVLVAQQQPAQALEHLRRAVAEGHAFHGYLDDPDLDPLRQNPEFEVLVAEVRRRLANAER